MKQIVSNAHSPDIIVTTFIVNSAAIRPSDVGKWIQSHVFPLDIMCFLRVFGTLL